MVHVQPYENVDDIYKNSTVWERLPDCPPEPFIFNQDGSLTIQVTTNEDGRSVSPDYDQLAFILAQCNTAPLKISMSHWDTEEAQPRILTRHAALLFANIHRWHALRIDAHLFNYLVCLKECQSFQDIPAAELKSLKIDQLNEAAMGDISPLIHFINQLFYSVPNQLFDHLNLDGTSFAQVMLSRKQIYNLPFNHLRSLAITTSIPGAQVYQILSAGGDTIEELFISQLTGPCPKPDVQPVHGKRLRVLKLILCPFQFEEHPFHYLGWVFGLLRKIRASALKELTLGYENDWDSQAFAEFYANSGGYIPLRVLRLEKMRLDARQFKKCMDLNPSLTELVVDCQTDVYNKRPPPLLFTREICDLFNPRLYQHYTRYLQRLVVREQCIEKSGCFGQMIKNLPSSCGAMLRELIILGKNAKSTLHPADRKAFEDLKERNFFVQYPDHVM